MREYKHAYWSSQASSSVQRQLRVSIARAFPAFAHARHIRIRARADAEGSAHSLQIWVMTEQAIYCLSNIYKCKKHFIKVGITMLKGTGTRCSIKKEKNSDDGMRNKEQHEG